MAEDWAKTIAKKVEARVAEEAERVRTFEGLQAAATYLQREVSRALRLRHTPHLRFVYDESVARGDRIERLLKEAREKDSHGGP